jgi:hypothetical protein
MIVTEVALHLMALPAVVVYGMLCSTKLSIDDKVGKDCYIKRIPQAPPQQLTFMLSGCQKTCEKFSESFCEKRQVQNKSRSQLGMCAT